MAAFYSLDLETKPLDMSVGKDQAYALEPYSCGTRSMITSVSITNGTKTKTVTDLATMPSILNDLKGKYVWTANGVFDVSYLMKMFGKQAVKDVHWMDVQLGVKLLYNGDNYREQHFSLVECCKLMIPDWQHLNDFVAMKAKGFDAGENADYWLERGDLDAEATWLVAERIMQRLPKSQIKIMKYMCGSIVPLSEGYLQGILVDHSIVDKLDAQNKALMKQYLSELGVPASVISSSKQLGNLLFKEWGLPVAGITPTGSPSSSADNIKLIAYNTKDPRMATLLKYKTLETIQSKYVKGFRKAREYLGRDTVHGSPRIFATATGRMSYSSAFFKKYQTSVALHQIPSRKKEAALVKRALVAPPGYGMVAFDVASQELKFMAIVSGDPVMLESFNLGLDLHSKLAASTFGVPYEDVVRANKTGDNDQLNKYRRAGKRTNLSSQYRISAKALSFKFFTQDDEMISETVAAGYLQAYKKTYVGIPEYWRTAVRKAKEIGYAETLGGLRYYTNGIGWAHESSAINTPVQGSAACQSYFNICKISQQPRFDEFILQVQVHDALVYIVPATSDEELKSKALMLENYLNNEIDYTELFDRELPCKLTVDVSYGWNYKELVAV